MPRSEKLTVSFYCGVWLSCFSPELFECTDVPDVLWRAPLNILLYKALTNELPWFPLDLLGGVFEVVISGYGLKSVIMFCLELCVVIFGCLDLLLLYWVDTVVEGCFFAELSLFVAVYTCLDVICILFSVDYMFFAGKLPCKYCFFDWIENWLTSL